ncbi:MAG: DNA polymerase III subunit gamma/tau [Candidatus Magasanikbacteria bacterium]
MSDLNFYRKYRPNKFEELLGQEVIKKVLKESARRNDFNHAYLFSGPRGTGKTTTARLIAKTVNCKKRKQDKEFRQKGEPCRDCKACQKIEKGKSMDIIEIDAASNRGIDEIRNLKEDIKTPPSTSDFKVFIIDEAHMLTKSAFNALLKTLEEPPGYVILILATTEPEKIPSTISSRTQKFNFKKVPVREIKSKLKEISEAENIEITQSALELIASSADGSFRDAESLLDQLNSMEEGKIIASSVENLIGRVNFNKLSELVDKILENNLKDALRLLNEIKKEGQDLSKLAKDLIKYLRKVAVMKSNENMKEVFQEELTDHQVESIFEHSNKFQRKHLDLLKDLIEAYSQMRYSQFPIIPLEVAIIENLKRNS